MAETRKVFKLIEMLPKIDNVLLKVERLAILMVIIHTKFEWPSINKLICHIRTTFFRLELSRLHGLDALTLKYYRYCFWLERVWSASLILSYRSGNYWYIATVVSFVISTICSACILELRPSKRQKSRKNGIFSPNPRQTNMRSEALTTVATATTFQEMDIFFLERFVSLFFVIWTSSYANFWGGIFCLFHVQYLIFFAQRLDYNFWPPLSTNIKNTREAWRYLFWIEQAATMILELHCVHGIPYSLAIARCLFVLTNIGYIVAQFIGPEQWQQKIIKTIFKFREAIKGEQSEKETPKIENDGPKENLENHQESAKEENNKWEEDLVEDDGQSDEKSEVEEEAVKDENNIWEEYLVEAHDHLKEKSKVDHREAAKEWERLILPELDSFLNWKEERRKDDEDSNLSGNGNSEIENELKATTAENVRIYTEEELVDIEEVERLKAENSILKREREFLEESERLMYKDSLRVWEMHNQKLNAMRLEANWESETLVGELEKHFKLEKDMLARLYTYDEDNNKWEQEKREIAAKLEALTAAFEKNQGTVQNGTEDLTKRWEDEKTELTQQLSAANSWYQYYYQVATHDEEIVLKLEQERNYLSAKLCAATQCSDYYRACFRDSEENSLRFMEKNNELARKLQDETILTSSYHNRVYELEEKCQMLEEAKTNLTAKLCAATASSELYRSMLHDAGY
ncbi:hypothetical protein ACE6H2_027748 [Prunus campanulata]